MKLLILRHAHADPANPGQDDANRPLSTKGNRRMPRIAQGLARLVPAPDGIHTSPKQRARQTAGHAARALGIEAVQAETRLAGDTAPVDQLEWLAGMEPEATVVVVGHEPNLSALAATAIGAAPGSIRLKKAGACLIEFDPHVGPGRGRLLWLATPRQLEMIGTAGD